MAARTWWKFTPEMCDRSEVKELSRLLELPTFAAAGAVALLYVWAINAANDDGCINDYTTKAIETACRWEGTRGDLLAAFRSSGIVEGDAADRDDNDPLRIANWANVAADILNERQRTRMRVQKHRSKGNAQYVTESVTRYTPDDVTRPKNKEVKNKEQKNNRMAESKNSSAPADLHEVETFCRDEGLSISPEKFFEFYNADGWKIGNTPVHDWKSLARAWNKSEHRKAFTNPALAYDQRSRTDFSDLMIDLNAEARYDGE